MDQTFFDQDDDFILDLDDALEAELEDTKWHTRISNTLNEDTPMEERVALYQEIRADGAIPDDAAFFLIAWAIETIAEGRAGEMFERQYAGRFAQLEEKYHLDAETIEEMEPEELPDEYRAIQHEFAAAIDALVVATFQAFGEHKMATLYKMEPESFDARYDAGYAFFFGDEEEGETAWGGEHIH